MPLEKQKIVLLPGDGIGPEVAKAVQQILDGCAIDQSGEPLPAETLAACRAADAVLLAAIGGPKWDAQPPAKRPESGLLDLRKALGLYVNLRPIDVRAPLRSLSPLRADRTTDIHIDFVRELAGDIYFGEHRVEAGAEGERATDVAVYTTTQVERVAKYAFARAEARKGRLASVDKYKSISAVWPDQSSTSALGGCAGWR